MAVPLAGFFFDPESQCGDGAYSSPLVVVGTVGSFPVVFLFFFGDLLLVPGHFLVRFSLDDFRVCWCYCLLNEMHGYLLKKSWFHFGCLDLLAHSSGEFLFLDSRRVCSRSPFPPVGRRPFSELDKNNSILQFGLQPSV
jgi:hypothetical protein